ncbi:MAG: hypothetical protein MEQ07_06715 [Aquimonas sp.]|nr:hypothetical protein [Aquimonas sp.]
MSLLRSAALLFAGVFALGFVLGVLRTLLLAPWLGELAAVAVELPVILAASWWWCGWLLRRSDERSLRGSGARALAMGAIALGLLLAAELGLSMILAGRSAGEHLALYALPAHQLGLAAQCLFGLMPWLWLRRRASRP